MPVFLTIFSVTKCWFRKKSWPWTRHWTPQICTKSPLDENVSQQPFCRDFKPDPREFPYRTEIFISEQSVTPNSESTLAHRKLMDALSSLWKNFGEFPKITKTWPTIYNSEEVLSVEKPPFGAVSFCLNFPMFPIVRDMLPDFLWSTKSVPPPSSFGHFVLSLPIFSERVGTLHPRTDWVGPAFHL